MPITRRKGWRAAALVTGALALGLLAWAAPGRPQSLSQPMPDFENQAPAAWINSPPLHAQALKGKVVLLDVFASG